MSDINFGKDLLLDKQAYLKAAEAVAPILRKEGKVDNPTPLADSAELEQQLATELKHTLKLVPLSQRELFVYELAQYISKHHQALLQKIEEAVPTPRPNGGPYNTAIYEFRKLLNQAREGKL